MADTHLSIETTYIAYPICYTMMLLNMPFRKADAHPLRLNTRCKDLTLVPSSFSYPGAHPCRRTFPKIFHSDGVFTFFEVRGRKKDAKK